MNSATPIKRKPLMPKPTDHIEQCVLDMRRIYPELSEHQLINMLERKYKIPYNRAKSILNREAKA